MEKSLTFITPLGACNLLMAKRNIITCGDMELKYIYIWRDVGNRMHVKGVEKSVGSLVGHVWPECKCSKGARWEISRQMTICLIFFSHCICKLTSFASPSAIWLTGMWSIFHFTTFTSRTDPEISPLLNQHLEPDASRWCAAILIYTCTLDGRCLETQRLKGLADFAERFQSQLSQFEIAGRQTQL